jgi:hypothetical protein
VIVIIGLLLDRIRIYVTSWAVPPEHIHDKYLVDVANTVPTVWPDVFDIFIILGGIGAAALVVLLVFRAIPIVSVWQMQEYHLLSKPVKYIRGHGVLVAKPD